MDGSLGVVDPVFVTQELAYGGEGEFKLSQPPIYFILAPQNSQAVTYRPGCLSLEHSFRSYLLALPSWFPGQVKPESAELCLKGPPNGETPTLKTPAPNEGQDRRENHADWPRSSAKWLTGKPSG